jgi:hypothetical protein
LLEPYFTGTTIDVVLVAGGPHAAHFSDGFGAAWREVDQLLRSRGLVP